MGLNGGYVDDLLRSCLPGFRQLAKKTNERFQMDDDEQVSCTFTFSGFSPAHGKDSSLEQNQHFYLQKLERLHLDASFSEFRSMRMRLAWLANTRPDCQFEISQLAQVTKGRYLDEQPVIFRCLNKVTRYATDHRVSLKIPTLYQESLRVVGFADASFANNHDLSTQLGHICFLSDCYGRSVPITFNSGKSKRVVRSAMAGEVIAFSDLFDIATTLASELGEIYSRRISVQLLTDCKALFDVISKGSRTSEKRTMLDIAVAREGFRNKFISDIGFIRSSKNIADGLTKSMSQAALQAAVSTGILAIHSEQWIIRSQIKAPFLLPHSSFLYCPYLPLTSRTSITRTFNTPFPPHLARFSTETSSAVGSSASMMAHSEHP